MGNAGRRLIGLTGAQQLRSDAPAFLRNAALQLAHLGPEPDRRKSSVERRLASALHGGTKCEPKSHNGGPAHTRRRRGVQESGARDDGSKHGVRRGGIAPPTPFDDASLASDFYRSSQRAWMV